MNLRDKKILLGITGSIAAFKTPGLVRLLVKAGAHVKVVMTDSAKQFVTPLTLSVLSKNQVYSSFTSDDGASWVNHVELGLWADVIIIAPATAKILSKCASGHCDDLLSAVYLSARCPVFFAPAMDADMFNHPSTRQNIKTLAGYGNQFVDSPYGELASGLIGEGRLAEPEEIVSRLNAHFSYNQIAASKRVLITAGPTVEAIDPVRFISNRSSGKMGYALAKAFADAGAMVTIVSGPTRLKAPDAATLIPVESAHEMHQATAAHFAQNDLVIFAAAVADYRSKHVADKKIKKSEKDIHLEFTKTVDIAGSLSPGKRENQIVIGFALETDNEVQHASQKLFSKNFDYIILNSLNDVGAGFSVDTNKITAIDKNNRILHFDLKSKDEVAQDILSIAIDEWSKL